jgi:hypothetical protein
VSVRAVVVCVCLSLAGAARVAAFPGDTPEWLGHGCQADAGPRNLLAVTFEPAVLPAEQPKLRMDRVFDPVSLQASGSPRVVPVEYSEAYKVRARIHKIASFATLPIFASMYVVGQDLYNHPGESESKTGLHAGLAATTAALFGVNTVTGVWNLWEGRNDSHHRTRRVIHGVLMLVADAGFVATGLVVPDDDEGSSGSGRRSTHRAIALTSMGVATVGYLMMLVQRD